MIHVVVTGSECTGKTTLAKALAEHYETVWVPEFARHYATEKSALLSYGDVTPIARGQIALQQEKTRLASRLLVHDTDLLSTLVYSHHYYKDGPDWIETALQEGPEKLYLLLDIDIPWVPEEGLRDRGHRREEMQELFRSALDERGLRFVEIRGLGRRRLEAAVSEVDRRILGRPRSRATAHRI